MKIIVGLGNPGKEYENTRHNAGWLVLDALAEQLVNSNWQLRNKIKAEISEVVYKDNKLILIKPQTFMNKSGFSVRSVISYYQRTSNYSITQLLNSLFVIHDDLDLPLGTIRIAKDRGSAGHKGVQSIVDHLKTENFIRFRIGIAKTGSWRLVAGSCEDYVLNEFRGEERKVFDKSIEKCTQAVIFALENGIDKAMNEYN